MSDLLRKTVLQLSLPVLLTLIILDIYFAIRRLEAIRENARARQESSFIQANVSDLLIDFDDMETGQRGYLITGDVTYLQPYSQAISRFPVDFVRLRSKLLTRSQNERELEERLESLSRSKTAEGEQTIRLRQKGYRHRAFLMISSESAKEAMQEARNKLTSLFLAAGSSFAAHDRETNASIQKARSTTIWANLGLLIAAVIIYGALRFYLRRLEAGIAQRNEALREVNLRLRQVTSMLSQQVSELLLEVHASAQTLVVRFGDYLPPQGQEHLQRIQADSAKANQVMLGLLAHDRAA